VTNPNFEYDKNARAEESFLSNEIKHLRSIQDKEKWKDLQAITSHYNKKLGGIWSAINKEKKPRNLIQRLKVPGLNPPQYEHCTARMANLA
jgi:hypothetical protein